MTNIPITTKHNANKNKTLSVPCSFTTEAITPTTKVSAKAIKVKTINSLVPKKTISIFLFFL